MDKIIMFLGSYIIVYLVYLFSVILFKSKYEVFKKGIQVRYFTKRFNLKFKNISEVKFFNLLALVNAFIISTTFVVALLVKGLLAEMLLAFVVFIPLIFITYELFGLYLKKKEGK